MFFFKVNIEVNILCLDKNLCGNSINKIRYIEVKKKSFFLILKVKIISKLIEIDYAFDL